MAASAFMRNFLIEVYQLSVRVDTGAAITSVAVIATIAIFITAKFAVACPADSIAAAIGIFYAIGWLAFLFIIGALFLVVIPMNDPNVQNNSQVLHANNLWQMHDKPEHMKNHKFFVTALGQTEDSQLNFVDRTKEADNTNIFLGLEKEDE